MLVRVAEPGKPAFQLRKGEAGISVFDLRAVDPHLTEQEVLLCFRPGNHLVLRSRAEIETAGLQVAYVAGSDALPPRLRQAHAEIQPGIAMTRGQFKETLKGLE
jgi:hypothetical protein